jgi:hypothetical protein
MSTSSARHLAYFILGLLEQAGPAERPVTTGNAGLDDRPMDLAICGAW